MCHGWWITVGRWNGYYNEFNYHKWNAAVDFYDPSSQKLIWRGSAAETLNTSGNQEKDIKKLDKGIAKLLKNCPPQKKDMNISSYLNDASDAIKLNVQFGTLPDGTNHIANLVIDGISKQLSVAVTNSDYGKL